MRFLTWCNKIDERSELLFKSAKHFGIELEPIGLGKEYRGGASKIEWLLDCLKSEKFHPAEDIVAVDAFDSLFVRNPGENELHWELSECRFPILYSGERNYSKRPPELQGYFSVVHDIITEG